ncbi:MAG: hypothetical protein JSS83_24390 [Cyanobacteria bacterium SZAS LIN-3]|nr:hypothetical protein [Cyanobacteria bacterium SZAS LIN-3]
MSKYSHRDKYEPVVMTGRDLSDDEAARLEATLEKNPSDWQTRFQLLGYYSRAQYSNDASRKKHSEAVLWLIENIPDCGVLNTWGQIHPEYDPTAYEAAKRLWLTLLDTRKDDLRIIEAAAGFLAHSDRPLAEKLLQRANELDPKESQWQRSLAMMLRFCGSERSLDAMHAMQKAIKNERGNSRKFHMMLDLAQLAYDAKQFKQAGETARKCLANNRTQERNWDYGNVIHDANSILGRIALHSGAIEVAKEHLREAGKSPGSPQLGSFGPSFELAAELYEIGEVDCVLDYLEDCKKFWKRGVRSGNLERGIDQIRQGVRPDFESRFADHGCDGGTDCDHK